MESTVIVACDLCTLESAIPENTLGAYCSSSGCHRTLILRPVVPGLRYVKVVCKEGYQIHLVADDKTTTKCGSCGADFNITDEVVEIKSKQSIYGSRKAVALEEQVRILKTDLSSLKLSLANQYAALNKKEAELDEMKKQNTDITNQLAAEQDEKEGNEQEIEELKSKIVQLEKKLETVQDRCKRLQKASADKEKLFVKENRSLRQEISDLELQAAISYNGTTKKQQPQPKSKSSHRNNCGVHQKFGECSTNLMDATLKFLLVRGESSQKVADERKVDEDAAVIFWLFIANVARDQEKLPHLIQWTNRKEYEFQLLNVEGVAQLWSERIGRGRIDGKNLLCALSYFDEKKLITKVEGQKNVYRFTENYVMSNEWWNTGLTALMEEYKNKKMSFAGLFGEEIYDDKNNLELHTLRKMFFHHKERSVKLAKENKELKEQIAKLTQMNCMLMKKNAGKSVDDL